VITATVPSSNPAITLLPFVDWTGRYRSLLLAAAGPVGRARPDDDIATAIAGRRAGYVDVMVETRIVISCRDVGVFWQDGGTPSCTDPSHEHQRFEVHHHRSPVTMPDGTTITAVSFDDADPYRRDEPPDFGLYLDPRWRPPWRHMHLDWPDFGVPDAPDPVVAALAGLLERARNHERVEIGCLGAHGRTGTALAVAAILCGIPPQDAVDWVRTTYCDRAVETEAQQAFVAAITLQA
jgi:hypothetical protein